ncbi:MAG: F0F1 ATP synthase subunit epsilon [Patescibacteria group bacterium]
MKLEAYALQKILYTGEISSLTCKTAAGEITILDHHKPIISVLAPGTIAITATDGKKSYFEVKSGFLEVQAGNSVRIIADIN